jgi:hypothetical protein
MPLTGNRRSIAVKDRRLEDRVADNLTFNDLTESEEFLIGRDFGVVTDIHTGPNGNLFVVSLTQGAVYEISRKPGKDDNEEDDDDDDEDDDDENEGPGKGNSKGRGRGNN